jgi:hypothetical protein
MNSAGFKAVGIHGLLFAMGLAVGMVGHHAASIAVPTDYSVESTPSANLERHDMVARSAS